MHPADVPLVRQGQRAAPRRHGRSLISKLMLRVGSLVANASNFATFTPDLLLADGQDLSEFGLPARVIHTPGHTAGSLAFLFASGELFTGDTISHQTRPALAPFIENDEELRASLALLKRLPATTIYPGHGKPFPFSEIQQITF
jgi:glyoxylase-like metal-dependent hydrolase (beta-lactamase superfamily II)